MLNKRTVRYLFVTIIGLAAAIAIITIISGRLVPSDDPVAGSGDDSFPKLEGTNLLLEQVTIPDDLEGQLRLLVIAYDRDQQIFVDKWLLPLEELAENYPALTGYYVPLLPQDAADAALPIIGGMTMAASSDQDRVRTIIVFTDVDEVNEILEIPGLGALQLFLLDENGAILWRVSGNYDPATLESLESALNSSE